MLFNNKTVPNAKVKTLEITDTLSRDLRAFDL